MQLTNKGNDYLSGVDQRMWSLVYYILICFKCPIMFKVSGPDVPRKLNQIIQLFVPQDHEKCDEIINYLKQEMDFEERDSEDTKVGWLWGVSVYIHKFNGIETYLDQETCKRLSEYALRYLTDKFKKREEAFGKTCH